MKVIKIYEDKAICSNCGGFIFKKNEDKIRNNIFICNSCGFIWEYIDKVFKEPLKLNLHQKNINTPRIDYKVSKEDYIWIDKFIENSTNYFKCMLLNIIIPVGDCYDINMVRSKCIKKQILHGLEREIGYNIDLDKANEVCNKCKKLL